MNEKELINSIKQLKEIKPNQEWVSLLKSQIITAPECKTAPARINPLGLKDFISNFKFQIRNYNLKPAYAFATVLLLFVGVVSVSQFVNLNNQTEILSKSVTALEAKALSIKVDNLAKANNEGKAENINLAVKEVKDKVAELGKALKDNPTKDGAVVKEIADSLKVLATMQGTEMQGNVEIKALYQTIVEAQITDLEEATLTEEQTKELEEIITLYNDGEFVQALEKILLINSEKVENITPLENSK